MIFLYIVMNYLLGCFVCALIDEWCFPGEDRLLAWAGQIPLGTILVASCWPIILGFAIRYKTKDGNGDSQ